MRALIAVVLLAACGASPRGPAWPKERVAESDGGESLAPHTGRAVAVEASPDDDAEAAPEAEPADEAAAADPEPDPEPAATLDPDPDDDEPITTEDITIEIDDDDDGGDDGGE